MFIKSNNSSFETCPEYMGKAVCVDITPLRRLPGAFGDRDVFKIVFEVALDRPDGSPFCVWSKPFTPSINEKANLRKFLRGWFGRDLTKAELDHFDTDSLLGKPAQLVVVHEHKDDEVYANIAACSPLHAGDTMSPSGTFVRAKDRPPKDGSAPVGGGAPPAAASATAGYRRAAQPEPAAADLGATKIHGGRCKGLEVRELAPEQVQALIDGWLPTARANPRPLADDKRLIAALTAWMELQQAAAASTPAPSAPEDDVPY